MAESIKFTDKYIDTTGVYDSTLNKTQQVINSKLVTVDTSSSSIGTPNPVNADTLGGMSSEFYFQTTSLINPEIQESDSSGDLNTLTQGGYIEVIASSQSSAASRNFPYLGNNLYYTKGILQVVKPLVTTDGFVRQFFYAIDTASPVVTITAGNYTRYCTNIYASTPVWSDWEPLSLKYLPTSYGNITVASGATSTFNVHSLISGYNPNKVISVMPYFKQNMFSTSIYLDSSSNWNVVVHNFHNSSLTTQMYVRWLYY